MDGMIHCLIVKAQSRKKYLVIAVFLVTVLLIVSINTNSINEKFVKNEITLINNYLDLNSNLCIKEIPPWISIAPLPIKTKKLANPRYIVMPKEENNIDFNNIIFYYPFKNKKIASRYYSLLKNEGENSFYQVSSSLFYISKDNEKYLNIIQAMELDLQSLNLH